MPRFSPWAICMNLKSFIQLLLNLFQKPSSKWKQACPFIKAAMITPLFAYNDSKQVAAQAKALARSGLYNAACGLLDLQDGRPYIFRGRNATALNKKTAANISTVLDSGLTPILIIRNDWGVRTRQGYIPSINGPAPANQNDFYSPQILETEKQFLKSLKDYFPHVHFQISIEPNHPAAAPFALQLAKALRDFGFKNKILINPIENAVAPHEKIRKDLNACGVTWARSWHKLNSPPPDPIWNTDGDTNAKEATAKAYLAAFDKSKKEYILWGVELANCPNGIPTGYL